MSFVWWRFHFLQKTLYLRLSVWETGRRTVVLVRASLIAITFTSQNILTILLKSQLFAGVPSIPPSIINRKLLRDLPAPRCCGLCCHQVETSTNTKAPIS